MPFIDFKTSKSLTRDEIVSLKTKFGSSITALGKSENWLMVNLRGESNLFFKGEKGDFAIAEISLFGKASDSRYDEMTKQITDIISDELEISPSCIYVKYEEVEHWGFGGFNF